MNKYRLPLILCLALGFQLVVELNPSFAQAENAKLLAQLPTTARRGGIPDKRKPAGTRTGGPCEEIDLPFTPVLPIPEPVLPITEAKFSGLTLQSHPTFWFYVPTHRNRATYGRFAVGTEDEGERIWQSNFKLPPQSGFFSVTLPKTVKALEPGKVYRWTFSLYCTAENTTEVAKEKEAHLYHTGLIRRATAAELSSEVKDAPLDFYLDRKIWYDAADKLPEIRRSSQQWASFLNRMGMSAWQEEKVSGALYGNLPR